MLSDSFEKLHLTVTGRKSGDTFAEGADVNDALETLLKHFGIRDRKIPASLKGFEEKERQRGSDHSRSKRRGRVCVQGPEDREECDGPQG